MEQISPSHVITSTERFDATTPATPASNLLRGEILMR
jgi:hypothetical protein